MSVFEKIVCAGALLATALYVWACMNFIFHL